MSDLQTRSYWLGMDAYTPNPPLADDLEVDVAIVGGGFTGLWSAYFLLEENPGLRVAIFEAEAVGYGASGRNGGFCMTKVHNSLTQLAMTIGDEAAHEIHSAAVWGVKSVTDTIARESIACDPQPDGLMMLATNPMQDRYVEKEVETAVRLGFEDEYTLLDRVQAQERFHSQQVTSGFREEHCTLINPARLARGLKRVVEERGAQIYEGTAVQDWEEQSAGVELRTSGGTVRADRAIVGVNAYGTQWRATRRRVLPHYSFVSLTRPLSKEEWDLVGWKGGEAIEDFRMVPHYIRPTVDGRILWGAAYVTFRGKGPKSEYDRDATAARKGRETFEWFLPQLAHVPFEHSWGGPVAITGHLIPGVGWFDRKSRKVAYAYGYNGHGVSITHVAARALADLCVDRKSQWTDLWFVGRPPPDMGPQGFPRDTIIGMTLQAMLRADAEGRRTTTPLPVRVLTKLSRRS